MAIQAGEPATALLDTPGSTPAALPAAPPATAPSDAPVAARAPLPAAAAAPAPQVDIDAVRRAASLPPGSFQQSCNICGSALAGGHHFYHQLCVGCGDLNFAKRNALAPMSGKVAVVTGGRVRIGFHIVLKLLRCGCHVLTTTRYPADAAARYGREPDFEEWRGRLEVVGPLDLCDLGVTERFCDALHARFERIDVLINNAAQTLTRAPEWFEAMDRLEEGAARDLPPASRQLLLESASSAPGKLLTAASSAEARGEGRDAAAEGGNAPVQEGPLGEGCGLHFPPDRLDESMQPLDLSPINSWSRKLGQIGTSEMLHTVAANAVAPFILCSRLRGLLAPPDAASGWGHIVNVNALEGKFSVTKKQSSHPHTNMAKAALNMLTCTAAIDLAQARVLINSVDTGWVTDMAPGGVGVLASIHETQVAPPLDEVDGAARVLDPVFSHINDPTGWRQRGKLWKDYRIVRW
ncbi:hypothetical protein EMIHUDRAFT_69843 [Emiliania huxleyi CCMP1516]|uniref:Oxidoreductase n=2 Tax=Emiliania huxleyi TaxID=2903 RepID=A0A0D3KWR3_EMIH1|nr:hypothetical protein EMIHUDRAFT_69843 [Emiliania huxleyi CCMP1516]EOD40198.1 hypothetical protein EMIHUDRAFT_69843 [Emiliania huxleyi CCMP1516]|eukprot:XP_005792627.1 hypothetical protein EMIHUDRAFT_69843 [Emiliania huxleyi CCMP1516]